MNLQSIIEMSRTSFTLKRIRGVERAQIEAYLQLAYIAGTAASADERTEALAASAKER